MDDTGGLLLRVATLAFFRKLRGPKKVAFVRLSRPNFFFESTQTRLSGFFFP